MAPEVTQFGSPTSDNKQRRSPAERQPVGALENVNTILRHCGAGEYTATEADHGGADRPGSRELGREVLRTEFHNRNA